MTDDTQTQSNTQVVEGVLRTFAPGREFHAGEVVALAAARFGHSMSSQAARGCLLHLRAQGHIELVSAGGGRGRRVTYRMPANGSAAA